MFYCGSCSRVISNSGMLHICRKRVLKVVGIVGFLFVVCFSKGIAVLSVNFWMQ